GVGAADNELSFFIGVDAHAPGFSHALPAEERGEQAGGEEGDGYPGEDLVLGQGAEDPWEFHFRCEGVFEEVGDPDDDQGTPEDADFSADFLRWCEVGSMS